MKKLLTVAAVFAASVSVTMQVRAETLPEAAKRIATIYERSGHGAKCDDAILYPGGKLSTATCRHQNSTALSVLVVGTKTTKESQRKHLEAYCETIAREDKSAAISGWPIEAERFAGFCNYKPR
ncbi:MAG: hypothetical protein J0I42_13390 [Bosea sp.]|uniref:hypothetical protein n=1 Tax=Bosea sp. (in: a-proteobacteria) TaxID=1871050 RepID=UPI001AC2EBE4|nr:hypothetical protein [Bosea sp. (in: a-proteobacteria)]MBN9452936.1 hypothetical protein [Bosea sp. (in: a-proteobacteria)]